MTWNFLAICLAATGLAVSGCTGRSTLDTVPVEGVVTLDGDPVEGATVTFVPVNEGQGMSAAGRTDERGVYRLTAVGNEEGAGEAGAGTLPGEYYVGVRKAVAEEGPNVYELEEQGIEYEAAARPVDAEVQFIVPRKYRNPRNSGLTATVTEGENKIDLELTN